MEKRTNFFNIRISWRLALGFGALVAILAGAVALTQHRMSELVSLFNQVVELRQPTASNSLRLVSNINGSLASLRGWMLTSNPAFIDERAATWKDIDALMAEMEGLSTQWEHQESVAAWNDFKTIVVEFKAAQKKVEDIANSPDQFPASRMLAEQTNPLMERMRESITTMIDLEGDQVGDEQRKALLGIMGRVRANMEISVSAIRSFMLTGDPRYRAEFEKYWTATGNRMEDLYNWSHLLSEEQTNVFMDFTTALAGFSPMPEQLFELRSGPKANMANYYLVQETIPRGNELLDLLSGRKNEAGQRSDGLVDNQLLLLSLDAARARGTATDLRTFLWGILAAGAALGTIVGLLISWSIVKPVREMTHAMGRLAEGDFSVSVPALERRDEIGEMAHAVQVFKINGEQIQVMETNARSIVETLAQTTTQVAGAISHQASTASQQAAAVTQTSTALEEIGETARNTMSQARDLSSSAEQTLQRGRSGRKDMEQVVQAMSDIRDKVEAIAHTMMMLSAQTRRVGEITDAVGALAQQSKMLAINASIEAAKAGDSGKGFAVVAEEVASLADQSEQATDQVRSVLDQIQAASEKAIFATEEGTKQVDAGVNLIHVVGEGMNVLIDVIDDTVAATRRMVDAINQQTTGIQQVAGAMDDITQGTGQIAESSTQIQDAIENLSAAVNRLSATRS